MTIAAYHHICSSHVAYPHSLDPRHLLLPHFHTLCQCCIPLCMRHFIRCRTCMICDCKHTSTSPAYDFMREIVIADVTCDVQGVTSIVVGDQEVGTAGNVMWMCVSETYLACPTQGNTCTLTGSHILIHIYPSLHTHMHDTFVTHPCRIKNSAASVLDRMIAQWSGVLPRASMALRSAPARWRQVRMSTEPRCVCHDVHVITYRAHDMQRHFMHACASTH